MKERGTINHFFWELSLSFFIPESIDIIGK